VTNSVEPAGESAEHRLDRLVNRLLDAADSAAASGSWDRVIEIAEDILVVDPDNERAAGMLGRARGRQFLSQEQRALVSMLFSDIVRSTDLADEAEPEVVRDLFRVYRQAATEAIEGVGGDVVQFQGDGVVACFGYPNAYEDDAKRAVLAGLGLVERMAVAGPELRRRYGIDAPVRVGVHTGTVVVSGHTSGPTEGSDIAGVATNLAARLQAEADPDTVVISDATKELVEADFDVVEIGTRSLKGISRPVPVFRVLRARDAGRLLDGERLQSGSVVGRDGPRRRLKQLWENVLDTARQGRPPERAVVLLRGAAGIGKSRLAAELCDQVRADGGAVLPASCSAYHTNVALWPIGRMIEYLLGLYPEQPQDERRAEVERQVEAAGLESSAVIPLLAPLLGLEFDGDLARPEVDAMALRAQTLEALRAWLDHFAHTRPSLLLVEDAHWADPTTIDWLGLVAGSVAPGVMAIATSRDPLNTPWADRALDIELGPLSADEAAQLVAEMVKDDGLSSEQRQVVIERGGGIPLFIQELTRGASTTTSGKALPPRLQELFAVQLRSPGVDLRTAQMAATLGSVFDEGLLRELSGGPVFEALAGLQAAGIVEPVGDARRSWYRFRHVLLRDATYETQVLDVRQATHERIANLLRATAAGTGDMAIVAEHFDLAGNAAESVPTYIAAAQAAQADASHIEARRLLDRALELIGSLAESAERDLAELNVRMLRAMSVSSLFGYGYEDVLDDFQHSDRICGRHTDRLELVPARLGIWGYMLVRGELGAAGVVLEPLMASVDLAEMGWIAPEVRSCMGYHAFYEGDLSSARRLLEQAWADFSARPAGQTVSPLWPLPNDPVPVTAVALACVASLQGRTEERYAWEDWALGSAREIGFPRAPWSLAFVNTYLAWLRMIMGDVAGARVFGERTMEIAAQHRFDYWTVLGQAYVLAPEPGRPTEPDQLDQCLAAMDLMGHLAFRPALLGMKAVNYHYLGDQVRALDSVEAAILQAHKSGELVHEPNLLRLRAEITAVAHPERIEDVTADVLAAVQLGVETGSVMLALRAANTLAGMPEAVRPGNWREVVQSVVHRFPSDSRSPELSKALGLLRG
jgi:class 3 adenylate cyclase